MNSVVRPRIAYLTSSYARAADTFVRREVEELRRIGWEVHTFSIRRPGAAEIVSEDVAREQRTTDYILQHGPWRLLSSLARLLTRSPMRVARAVRQAGSVRRPGVRSSVWHIIYLLEAAYLAEQLVARDIALLHDHISMNSGTVAMLASTMSGVPFSMTVHGPHEFLDAVHWSLGTKIAASAATACISDFGRSQCMLFSSPAHWRKLQVVRCGLERELLDAPISRPSATARLTCVGRLCPEKGQVLLVEAAALLRDEGLDVEIVLVGDGPSRSEIEQLSTRLGVTDRIRIVGWQPSAEVHRLMAESRIVVLPSFAEGIPVVLMEAMALARPVIATCVGGIPELVRSGENGWLIAAGSLNELCDAIRQAVQAPPELVAAMGERARESVSRRHDLAVEVRKLANLFGQVLGQSEARNQLG